MRRLAILLLALPALAACGLKGDLYLPPPEPAPATAPPAAQPAAGAPATPDGDDSEETPR